MLSNILTQECASRHNGVHLFDISASKSALKLARFAHVDFEMRFVPQWRALFRHLNFQKCSENGVFCIVHFDFEMCFAPQRRALLHSQLPKSGLRPSVFTTFDFEMCFAPQRHAIFHLSSPRRLRTRRFSEPTFRSSGATNHQKNTVFRDFTTFLRTCIFCLLTFSLL